MANQAALTCLDFQHIKQVGLGIKVTPSVSAEGGDRARSITASSPRAGQKEKPWAEERWGGGAGGVTASCPACSGCVLPRLPLAADFWEPQNSP